MDKVMGKGELFRREFRVTPAADGSFILSLLGPERWGFTDLADLMAFLRAHHAAATPINSKAPLRPVFEAATPAPAHLSGFYDTPCRTEAAE